MNSEKKKQGHEQQRGLSAIDAADWIDEYESTNESRAPRQRFMHGQEKQPVSAINELSRRQETEPLCLQSDPISVGAPETLACC